MTPIDDLYGTGSWKALREAFTYYGKTPSFSKQLAQDDGSVVIDTVQWPNGSVASLTFAADSVFWGTLNTTAKGLYRHLCLELVPELTVDHDDDGPGLLAKLGVRIMYADAATPEAEEALRRNLPWERRPPRGLLEVRL